jgi:hypothetical protein
MLTKTKEDGDSRMDIALLEKTLHEGFTNLLL